MSAPTPFEPGASLARVTADSDGFLIDTRGPKAAQQHRFASAGNAAEMAIVLREAGWALRFSPGADEVRALVSELDEIGFNDVG